MVTPRNGRHVAWYNGIMLTLTCRHCGNDFETYPSHGDRKFCSRACSDAGRTRNVWNKSLTTLVCETCGAAFDVPPSRVAAGARFCSVPCARLVNKGRAPMNAKPRLPKACLQCGVEFFVRSSAAKFCSKACADASRIGQTPWNKTDMVEKRCEMCNSVMTLSAANAERRTFCSKDCADKHKRSITGARHPLYKPKVPMTCEQCGSIVFVKPSLVSRFRFCSRRCAGSWVSGTWPRTSSIERMLHRALRARSISFTTEYPIGQFVIDIAFPDARLAVEADGKYWHSRESQKRKDRQKDGYLQSVNWSVLRLPEDDIRADVDGCVDKIIAQLPHPK